MKNMTMEIILFFTKMDKSLTIFYTINVDFMSEWRQFDLDKRKQLSKTSM